MRYDCGEFGISWSTKRSVAEKFAYRQETWFDQDALVHEIEIDKKDVVAYLNGRKEFEVIYLE